jgi:hypothetical protein
VLEAKRGRAPETGIVLVQIERRETGLRQQKAEEEETEAQLKGQRQEEDGIEILATEPQKAGTAAEIEIVGIGLQKAKTATEIEIAVIGLQKAGTVTEIEIAVIGLQKVAIVETGMAIRVQAATGPAGTGMAWEATGQTETGPVVATT